MSSQVLVCFAGERTDDWQARLVLALIESVTRWFGKKMAQFSQKIAQNGAQPTTYEGFLPHFWALGNVYKLTLLSKLPKHCGSDQILPAKKIIWAKISIISAQYFQKLLQKIEFFLLFLACQSVIAIKIKILTLLGSFFEKKLRQRL